MAPMLRQLWYAFSRLLQRPGQQGQVPASEHPEPLIPDRQVALAHEPGATWLSAADFLLEIQTNVDNSCNSVKGRSHSVENLICKNSQKAMPISQPSILLLYSSGTGVLTAQPSHVVPGLCRFTLVPQSVLWSKDVTKADPGPFPRADFGFERNRTNTIVRDHLA